MTTEPRREELLDLALGLLEPEEARALEAHAERCAACRAELAALRQTRQLVAGLPPLPAPERGAAVLLAAARQAAEAAAEARRPRWALPRWLAGGALGLAGATALLLLVLRDPVAPTRGPLSEDREALLGQAAPAVAPAVARTADEGKAAEKGRAGPVARQAPPRAGAPVEKRVATPIEERAAPPVESNVVARDQAREASSAAASEPPASVAPPAPARKSEAAVGGAGPGRAALARPSAPPARVMADDRSGEEAAPCRLERRRHLVRDGTGRLVGRVREGRYPAAGGEVALRVEERFGPDGKLLDATVRAGDRLYVVTDEDAAAGRLEPLPGVLLAPTAEAAEQAPPRCEP
jgi:anti-sigma factor RsiW